MLMVFLAFPALQRSQNDTQRRNTLSQIGSQIVAFQTNNRGKVPGASETTPAKRVEAWNNFLNNYLRQKDTSFLDPDGNNYYISSVTELTTAGTVDNGATETAGSNTDTTGKGTLAISASMSISTAIKFNQELGGKGGVTDSTLDVATGTTAWVHPIAVYLSATCDGDDAKYVGTKNLRQVAYRARLESGGHYCGNN